MKSMAFARRNAKEILRDPLSFVFCLGFPVLLLAAFRVIQHNAGEMWMSPVELIPGVAVFSLAFDLLFMVLLVARDRGGAFLSRLFNAPMRTSDFILGYVLPCFALGAAQLVITYLAGAAIFLCPDGAVQAGELLFASKTVDYTAYPPVTVPVTVKAPIAGVPLAVLAGLPALLFFLFCGVLLGIALNDRAAPGVSSALITGAGFLGGCWMPLDTMGKFETVCRCLPFYPAVVLSRAAFCGGVETGEVLLSLLTVLLWALAAFVAATLAFRRVQKGTALRRGHLRCG